MSGMASAALGLAAGASNDIATGVPKTKWVSAQGSNTTGTGSPLRPYATLTFALTKIDNSGWQIVIQPGTYSDAPTVTAQNLTIMTIGQERGGLANFSGAITVSHAASSVRMAGITAATISHTSAGSLYLDNCRCNTALTSSGSGYLWVSSCDTQGSGLTGTISIAGSGIKVFQGGTVGALTVNNAAAVVSVRDQISCSPMTLTLGTLSLGVGPVYAAMATSNALTATGGTLAMQGVNFLTPAGTSARISIGASVYYDCMMASYDALNSIISGVPVELVELHSRYIPSGKIWTVTGASSVINQGSSGSTLTAALMTPISVSAPVGSVAILSGAISGAGAVTASGGGTLQMSGTNTYSGGTTIGLSTTVVASGSTLVGGGVTNSGTYVVDLSSNVTYANVMSGSGSFVKRGAGTLTLTNANTYTGQSTIEAGVLAVSGSLQSATTVGSGGAISGGAAITGNMQALTFAALASKYLVNVLNSASTSQLACTALAAANGFTIDVVGGAMTAGTYPVLTKTSGYSGTPTIGVNTTGRTVVFTWSGNTLNMVLA